MARLAALGASVGALQLAAGQQQEATLSSVDVRECVGLTAPEERLACFEAQVKAASGAPAADGAAAAASGTTGGRASRGRDEEDETAAPAPPDMFAKVAGLRETVPNVYLITLDNGQVWRQTAAKAYPLQPGSDVRIYYSRWGRFRLTSPQLRSFIQVERVH